jgi:hypothetical protein
MAKKHLFRHLLNKAISMALWTKAITCDKAGFKSRFCLVHQAGKIKIGVNQRNPLLIKNLRENKALYNCRETFTDVMSALQIHLFMQNKANFRKSQMYVSEVLTINYGNWTLGQVGKTNPIQTQYKANSNPIQTQYKANLNPNKPNLPQSPIILVSLNWRCIISFSVIVTLQIFMEII